jgi:hypothetical protein
MDGRRGTPYEKMLRAGAALRLAVAGLTGVTPFSGKSAIEAAPVRGD